MIQLPPFFPHISFRITVFKEMLKVPTLRINIPCVSELLQLDQIVITLRINLIINYDLFCSLSFMQLLICLCINAAGIIYFLHADSSCKSCSKQVTK
jgi:uncharacterized protein (DUF486 family)